MSPWLVFWFWVVLLAALLLLPVSNLIFVLSVRRQQRKLNNDLDANELRAQKQRARFIGAVVCFAFSLLFNVSRIGLPGGLLIHG